MCFQTLASLALFAVVCTGVSSGQTILGCAGDGESAAPKFVLAWKVEPARIQAFHSNDAGLEPLQRVFSYAPSDHSQEESQPATAQSFVRSNQPLRPAWASWHRHITTTVFWVGESTATAGPVDNRCSAWDHRWAANYGGTDDPNPIRRVDYRPVNFFPKLNPFYCALPYNDIQNGQTKTTAAAVVPWFRAQFQQSGVSVLRGKWVAIRKDERIAYARWEDVGPFETDDWPYVFGGNRPATNGNRGAGLDVSPAVRDYLGISGLDATDWCFVETREVPAGPWWEYEAEIVSRACQTPHTGLPAYAQKTKDHTVTFAELQ